MAKNPGDTTLTEFMDTAYNFKKIIEFDSDFYRANMDDGQIQNRQIIIDLKPILQIAQKQLNGPGEKYSYYLPSLEKLNKTNPLNIQFTIVSQLPEFEVDSVRGLLNATEQEKLKTSFNSYLYFYQGLLNSTLQNFNQSIKAYSAAIDLDPNFELAYFNRANTKYLMIEYLNSLEDYSQILTLEGKATTKHEEKKNNQQEWSFFLFLYFHNYT